MVPQVSKGVVDNPLDGGQGVVLMRMLKTKQAEACANPEGPSTNIMRNLGFYVWNFEYGLGQALPA